MNLRNKNKLKTSFKLGRLISKLINKLINNLNLKGLYEKWVHYW